MKTPTRLLLALFAVFLLAGRAPAAEATFKRGVNISHWLSQNFGTPYGAPWFGEQDVAWIASQGFDHIRLPVDFRLCLDASGQLDPAKLQPIEDAIAWSHKRGLGLILDAHFLPGADFNSVGGDHRAYTDPAVQAQAASVWRQMARHFAGEGPWVRFEILNEPVAAENAQVNDLMRALLAVIRESNPTRVVYVTSNRWSSFHTVKDVVLPNDPNIALTIHFYEPMIFTHQQASWAGFTTTLPPVRFPGEAPDVTGHTNSSYHMKIKAGEPLTDAQIAETFGQVAQWVAAHAPHIEVYVGEFGVFKAADPVSTAHWIRTVRTESESRGWGWGVWDYNDSFGVRARDGSGTAVLEGLFR
jgi:endoglucanase